jgi:hypothetical protein
MNQNNPLRQYFRQPAIYLRLPSQGKFYPDGTLELPLNNELPILPMTAIDEISYRTPDALFNGSAVVSVVHSCIPSIKDAWAIPAVDVDSILVGIRIASYGHEMEFESVCPHCGKSSSRTLDLRTVLDRIQTPDYTQPIVHGDMEIYLKPMTYKNLNDNNQMQFDEQKILNLIPDSEMPDNQKMEALSAALRKITEVTVHALSLSIATIKTPTAFVSEPEYIEDFLKNCDRVVFNSIRSRIIELKAMAELQPFEIECDNDQCLKKYTQSVTLDMASFFVPAS